MNSNGERLVEFCSIINLVIGGILFQHKTIHKLTWCSSNGRDKNQIDHLLINYNGKWRRRSLRDVKVRRGADVASDHHLVTAEIKLKLKRSGPPVKMIPRFDVSMLKNHALKTTFIQQLRNRFQALTVEENGETMRKMMYRETERMP